MATPPPLNSHNCPVTHAVRVMGRRWKPLVLNYLKPGPLRFSEIRRCLPEVTQKMLTQTLRELEKDGLIVRKVHSQVPPKVVYSVSRYGRTLDPILRALCVWGLNDQKRAGLSRAPGRGQKSGSPTAGGQLPFTEG